MCTQFIRNQVGTFIEIWRLRKPLSNEQWLDGFKITIFCLKPNFAHQQQMWVIFHPMTGAVIPSSRKFSSGTLWNTVCLQSFAQGALCFMKSVVTFTNSFLGDHHPSVVMWLRNCPHSASIWTLWSLRGGCVREGSGAFQRCSLAGGGTSVGVDLANLSPRPTSSSQIPLGVSSWRPGNSAFCSGCLLPLYLLLLTYILTLYLLLL